MILHKIFCKNLAMSAQSSLLWAVVIYMLLQNESHFISVFHFYNRDMYRYIYMVSLIQPNVKNAFFIVVTPTHTRTRPRHTNIKEIQDDSHTRDNDFFFGQNLCIFWGHSGTDFIFPFYFYRWVNCRITFSDYESSRSIVANHLWSMQ